MTSPQSECQLSPTIPKMAPNNPTSGKDTYRNSISNNNMAFTVQLPATITKKELKMLRRDDPPIQNSLKRSFPRSIDDAIETIKKEKISIFHSAEMLAIGESTNSLI
uniref:Reverse transcriptase domain-containing protein n=1 Tax=Caenorhabditis tropicalis TaxID=1561998 RepID=A0A1I7U711_9PELO